MTDFNGLNPDKHIGPNMNPNRQGKGAQPEPGHAPEEAGAAGDPFADLKVDPNHMLQLLAAQSKLNISPDVENPGISRAVAAFANEVSPERFARLERIVSNAYEQEFGKVPSPELLQDILADYLIGRPVIQSA